MAPLLKETVITLLRQYQAVLRRHEELEALMEPAQAGLGRGARCGSARWGGICGAERPGEP
jgi:hypothetical protein